MAKDLIKRIMESIVATLLAFTVCVIPVKAQEAQVPPTQQFKTVNGGILQELPGTTGGLARFEIFRETADEDIMLVCNNNYIRLIDTGEWDTSLLQYGLQYKIVSMSMDSGITCDVVYIVSDPAYADGYTSNQSVIGITSNNKLPNLLLVKYTDVPENYEDIVSEPRLNTTFLYYYYDKNKYMVEQLNSLLEPYEPVNPVTIEEQEPDKTGLYIIIAVAGLLVIAGVVFFLIKFSDKQNLQIQDKESRARVAKANKQMKSQLKKTELEELDGYEEELTEADLEEAANFEDNFNSKADSPVEEKPVSTSESSVVTQTPVSATKPKTEDIAAEFGEYFTGFEHADSPADKKEDKAIINKGISEGSSGANTPAWAESEEEDEIFF